VSRGTSEGQQLWECLCALIALRQWNAALCQRRTSLRVRGDNITMLTVLRDFKGSSPNINVIAREVALLVAAACYKPVLAEHVPGVANVLADVLSRKFQDGKCWRLPSGLQQAFEVLPPARPRCWYRTLLAPGLLPPVAEGDRRKSGGPSSWQ